MISPQEVKKAREEEQIQKARQRTELIHDAIDELLQQGFQKIPLDTGLPYSSWGRDILLDIPSECWEPVVKAYRQSGWNVEIVTEKEGFWIFKKNVRYMVFSD